jgi:hypothetical protein
MDSAVSICAYNIQQTQVLCFLGDRPISSYVYDPIPLISKAITIRFCIGIYQRHLMVLFVYITTNKRVLRHPYPNGSL